MGGVRRYGHEKSSVEIVYGVIISFLHDYYAVDLFAGPSRWCVDLPTKRSQAAEGKRMSDKRFCGAADRLQSSERLARLGVACLVPRVTAQGVQSSLIDIGTGVFAKGFVLAGLRVTGVDRNADYFHCAGQRMSKATARTRPTPRKLRPRTGDSQAA